MDRVLILDAHAAEYAAELETRRVGVTATIAKDLDSLPAAPHDIWLAQPDLAANALAGLDGRPPSRPPTWLQSTWAGVTPVVESAVRHGITLTGLKGVFGPLIAEYVFTYLLAQVRRPNHYRDSQRRHTWSEAWPETLRDKRIVIVGTGSIGGHIASTAQHFRMTAVGVSASGAPSPSFDGVFKREQLIDALTDADYIVACLPETPATRGLFDATAIAAMPAHALFVNVGRGSVVDHDALAAALRDQRLAAAVLDVFTQEPLPANSPLWDTPNLTITPHVAGVTYARDVIDCFVDNLRRFTGGQALQHQIDPRRGY